MTAILSPCGTYRYRLRREIEPLLGQGNVLVCMLNPSTADAEQDDPTIRKLIGFCRRMAAPPARFTVVNAFAYRATDPRVLLDAYKRGVDVVGPDNDKHIDWARHGASRVIVAWGGMHKALRWRIPEVMRLLGEGESWGSTADGMPRHPLMLSYSTALQRWAPSPPPPPPIARTSERTPR